MFTKQFTIILGVDVECGGGALLDRPCMVLQSAYVCCARDPNVYLDDLSKGFVCVCVCRKLSPHLII